MKSNWLLHRVRAALALRLPAAALCLTALTPTIAQQDHEDTKTRRLVTYLSREDAAPVFSALGEPLPSAGEWASWLAARDRETRARVAEGDETSIVNWLLFGTSFTSEPRVTDERPSADLSHVVSRRIDDFVRVVDRNHEDTKARRLEANDERLEFASQVIGRGESARRRLVRALARMAKEREVLEARDRDARQLGDSRLEFAERSRIYRDRGLSTDTSLGSSFAIDEALRQIVRDGKTITAVRRVAIIGPGVDFIDKHAGHDLYPPQTVQPFTIQDSLLRHGLARSGALEVVTLDLNARVNAHITRAVTRAEAGQPYAIRALVTASPSLTPDFASYWSSFGERIGRVEAERPAGTGLKVRTLQLSPAAVRAVSAYDVNVTAQRLELERGGPFDLVVATNVFLYYDRLQQGLAAANISRMLRTDGILLSNNAIVEVPGVGLRSVGYSRTQNSDNPEDGDLVIWYQKVR